VIAIADVTDGLRIVDEVCLSQSRGARPIDERPDRDPDRLVAARGGEAFHDLGESRAFSHRSSRSP
jgi:hypothetical protein